jgi:hypothetical protein
VETNELKILLALEPMWTLALNGVEFETVASSDIVVDCGRIRLGRWERRIDEVAWLRPNVVRLRVSQRTRSKPDDIILYPGEQLPSTAGLRRRRRLFQKQLGGSLADYFKTRARQRQMLYTDRIHGIGGAYPRFRIGEHAVIAVDPDESQAVVNAVMRAAILWSLLIRRRLTVVVPRHRGHTIATRLAVMGRLAGMFDWLEFDGERLTPLTEPSDNSCTEVREFHCPDVAGEVNRILEAAPLPLNPVYDISGRYVSIRFRGIEIAQVTEDRTVYPLGEPLLPVLQDLAEIRRHGSTHPLARAHEERWLESNLIGDIGRLLPSIDPAHVYPQVPSFVGEERNIIDLLTITADGRLVVIELKAAADPDLAFQALDYWIAVERHRLAGDFEKKGYFRGKRLKNQPALLVLVAPLLSFHRTTARLMAVFPGDVPLLEIGLNQAWKKEIKILRRRGLVS